MIPSITDNVFEDLDSKIVSEYYPEIHFRDYLEIDENLITTYIMIEESIVSEIRGEVQSDVSDEEITVNEEERSIEPTCESAAAAIKIMRAFLESHEDSSKPLMYRWLSSVRYLKGCVFF